MCYFIFQPIQTMKYHANCYVIEVAAFEYFTNRKLKIVTFAVIYRNWQTTH